MINKEIKTNAQASKVATEFANDLQDEVSLYGSYSVEKEKDSYEYRVILRACKGPKIITEPCLATYMKLYNVYKSVYGAGSVQFYIGTFKNENGYEYPAIITQIIKI